MLINVIEIIFYLFTLNHKMAFLYIKAYVWNILHIKDTVSARVTVQNSRVISDKEIFENMNFVSGKLIGLLNVGIPRFK